MAIVVFIGLGGASMMEFGVVVSELEVPRGV
jgi:hypothetical protein